MGAHCSVSVTTRYYVAFTFQKRQLNFSPGLSRSIGRRRLFRAEILKRHTCCQRFVRINASIFHGVREMEGGKARGHEDENSTFRRPLSSILVDFRVCCGTCFLRTTVCRRKLVVCAHSKTQTASRASARSLRFSWRGCRCSKTREHGTSRPEGLSARKIRLRFVFFPRRLSGSCVSVQTTSSGKALKDVSEQIIYKNSRTRKGMNYRYLDDIYG